jgi:hypothetical protein
MSTLSQPLSTAGGAGLLAPRASQAAPAVALPARAGELLALAQADAVVLSGQGAKPACEQQPPTSVARADEAAARPLPAGFGGRLESGPLFSEGSRLDEFGLTAHNLSFAISQFGLDPAFAALVSDPALAGKTRFSVVYHNDEQGAAHVDAYRMVTSAGKDSLMSAYVVKDPAFEPSKAYRTEMVSKVGEGQYVGTVLTAKRLTVPDQANPELTTYLTANGYQQREAVTLGSLVPSSAATSYFGLSPELGLHLYDAPKRAFTEQFKVFYQLCKDSPEYRALKIGDVLDNVGSAMLMGGITPELWKQGTAYGVASTISSIGNIGGPALGILGESALGSVVDNAVNSARPLDALKRVNLGVATAYAVKIGCNVAMHPALVKLMGSHPGWAFTGLYAASTGIGALSGVVSGKADMAIHDQLINKSPKAQKAEYAHNYYQILGVEASLARGIYLGAYSATVGALAAFPAVSLPLAAAGGAIWAGSQFIFPLYHEKPQIKATIEGSSYVHKGDRYVFDSGWEVAIKGGTGRLVADDDNHFSVAVDDGELLIRNTTSTTVTEKHGKDLAGYLPKPLALKVLGEKEYWHLDNGGHQVSISRYGNAGYHVAENTPGEFVVTRSGS